MELNYDIQNSDAIVTISSKILGTPADSKIFESNIKELVEKSINKVIIDLSNVNRINSTGLAILITGFHLLTNSGRTLALANLNDFVKGALTITKLDNVFQSYNSIEEAIAS